MITAYCTAYYYRNCTVWWNLNLARELPPDSSSATVPGTRTRIMMIQSHVVSINKV